MRTCTKAACGARWAAGDAKRRRSTESSVCDFSAEHVYASTVRNIKDESKHVLGAIQLGKNDKKDNRKAGRGSRRK